MAEKTGNSVTTTTRYFYQRLNDEDRIRKMVELSSDYYWEQDNKHRFTLIRHRDIDKEKTLAGVFMGRTWWELGGAPEPDNDSQTEHVSPQLSREPFHDLIVHHTVHGKVEKYFSISGQPVFDDNNAFLGYWGITRDVTEQKIHERLLRLEREIGRILLDVEKVDDGLRDAIHAICHSEGWEAGQYWILDTETQVMRYFTGWNIDTQQVREVIDDARQFEFVKGIGLVGAVWESGEPLWIGDLNEEKRLRRKDFAAVTGWRQGLLFPVTFGGDIVGVLNFYAPRIQQPDERLLNFFQVVGALIGNYQHRLDTMEHLAESEERYHSTVELAAIGIAHVDNKGRFLHVNPRFCSMLGYTPDELLSFSVKEISHPEDANITNKDKARLHNGEIEHFKTEKRYIHKSGNVVWVSLTVTSKWDKQGNCLYDISIIEDITARIEAEQRVQYLATHDEMTDLPNRALFLSLLSQAVESGKRYQRQFAVIFIDLDRFKQINDTLGHDAGDILLIEMAGRFKTCLRSSDIVARLGGDEFVVLVQEITVESQVSLVARNILSAAIRPVPIKGQDCRVTASLGICTFPAGATDEQTLMKNADMAMYHAKGEGKNNFQFYSAGMASHSIEKMALEDNLRKAMENDEFELHYQAKMDIRTGEMVGVEALLRWSNPELGPISPIRFIPVAEEMGLMIPLGLWVLKTACKQSISWQKQGMPPICISVNISPRQFEDPDLADQIREILEESGMAPHLLELEVTESMIMNRAAEAVKKLTEFKHLGVRIAIDDFGTGYSTLSQLKDFPINTLKVDRSFIRALPENEENQAVTEAIIAMGKTLGLTVIAEGVETEAQRNFLRDIACDELQGYLFSEAIPGDKVFELLNLQK